MFGRVLNTLLNSWQIISKYVIHLYLMLVCTIAWKSVLKANLDQQKKYYKEKKYCSLVHHTETSQTDLVCKSVEWFLYNRQIFQGKGLIITSVISTCLQLVYIHLITCQFLLSLTLKHFAFGSFLIESGTWFQRWVARKTKVFVPYFEPMTLGKLRRLVIRRL